jgi:hypothetical protein
MLSAACHEPSPPSPEEPVPAVYSFRRLDVTFENDERNGSRQGRGTRRRRPAIPTVSVPAYSRIVFRTGTVSVR